MSPQPANLSPHHSLAELSSPTLPFAREDRLPSPISPVVSPCPRLSDTDWDTVPSRRASPGIRIAVDLAYEPYPDLTYAVLAAPGTPTHSREIEISVRTRRGLEYTSTSYSFEADTTTNIVLFTRQPSATSPLSGFTHVHEGADLLDHFKRTLPTFLTNPIAFYDDISISVRGRLARAVRPSEDAENIPALGDVVTIPYMAYLVDCIIDYHRGSELISNFSWRCSDHILIVDIVPKALLGRYLDDPKAVTGGDIFTKYNGSLDPFEEFDDDEVPELKESFDIDEIETD